MVKAGTIIVALVALTFSAPVYAAAGAKLEPAGNDVDNTVSLQRGARNFMNYCSGCHSARYVRFNSVARGLGLSEDQVIENLMFNAEKSFRDYTCVDAGCRCRPGGLARPRRTSH